MPGLLGNASTCKSPLGTATNACGSSGRAQRRKRCVLPLRCIFEAWRSQFDVPRSRLQLNACRGCLAMLARANLLLAQLQTLAAVQVALEGGSAAFCLCDAFLRPGAVSLMCQGADCS